MVAFFMPTWQFTWMSNVSKVPVNEFKLAEGISESDGIFIRSYNEESDERYFLQEVIQYLENLDDLHINYLFYRKEWKLKKFHDKK